MMHYDYCVWVVLGYRCCGCPYCIYAGGVRLEPTLSFNWGTQGPPFPSGFTFDFFSMRLTFYFQVRGVPAYDITDACVGASS